MKKFMYLFLAMAMVFTTSSVLVSCGDDDEIEAGGNGGSQADGIKDNGNELVLTYSDTERSDTGQSYKVTVQIVASFDGKTDDAKCTKCVVKTTVAGYSDTEDISESYVGRTKKDVRAEFERMLNYAK